MQNMRLVSTCGNSSSEETMGGIIEWEVEILPSLQGPVSGREIRAVIQKMFHSLHISSPPHSLVRVKCYH